MGGSQSSHHQAERRWSFPTEIPLAPEACWELYRGWQIFHIDIELKTLPPHLRRKILNTYVDDYTQEVIPCDGEQKTHLCFQNQCVDDYTQEVIPCDGEQKTHLCFQNQCVDDYTQEIIPGDGTDGRQKSHVCFQNQCVDEYTQEVIPCDGEQRTHVCFSNHSFWRPSSASLVLRSGSSVENVCPEKDVRTHQRTGLQRSHSFVGTFVSGRRGKNMDDAHHYRELKSEDEVGSDDIQKECSSCRFHHGGAESDPENPWIGVSLCVYNAVQVHPKKAPVSRFRESSSLDLCRGRQHLQSANTDQNIATNRPGLVRSDCHDVNRTDKDIFGKTHRCHNRYLDWNPSDNVSTRQDQLQEDRKRFIEPVSHSAPDGCSIRQDQKRQLQEERKCFIEPLSQSTPDFPRKDYTKKTSRRGLWTFPQSSVNISPFTKTKACDKFTGRRRSTPSFPTGLMAGRSHDPTHSQGRKPGWKEEPGWIPNPLDSDSSDQDEPEESEAFYVSAQLSKRSSKKDPASIDPLDHSPGMGLSDRKEASKLSERRRCYSEPSSGRSSALSVEFPILKDNSGDDHHSDVSSPDTGAGWRDTPHSKWKLWRRRSRRRRSKAQSVDDETTLPPPANEDEESMDLEKELEWLVADPEKTLSTQDVESSNDTTTTPPEPSGTSTRGLPPSTPLTSVPPGWAHDVWRGEWGEVEWLCEPEWNNLEMEVFWSLLRPHLEHLLRVEVPGEDLLPLPRVDLSSMDASDHTMMDRCLLHVQRHIWTGNYRQAVADFRAVIRHFRSCAEKSGLLQCAVKNDVEVLRLVFFRKRPTRYRLWI